MKVVLDPTTALWTDGTGIQAGTPDEALTAMRGRFGVTVALVDVNLADAPTVVTAHAVPDALTDIPRGSLTLVEEVNAAFAHGFVVERRAVERLAAACTGVAVTAYPIALRRGLEALHQRPVGGWVFLEHVGNFLWLTVWNGPQLVHATRRLPADADLTGELLRSVHPLRVAAGADVAIELLTTSEALYARLRAEEHDVRITRIAGPSPAFVGLDELPGTLQFWLPEILRDAEARRGARRRVLQRVAASVLVLAGAGIVLGGEMVRRDAAARFVSAQATEVRLSVEQREAIRRRAERLRRAANHNALAAWEAALATVSPSERPQFTAGYERGRWQIVLTTPSSRAAHAFAAALGRGPAAVVPVTVEQRIAWSVALELGGGPSWIAWPSL